MKESISWRDENLIANILHDEYGLHVKSFTKDERRERKTPDFKVYEDNSLAFFCEVKTVEHDSSDDSRYDPVYNRLGNRIHEAAKQFRSVNPNGEYPNVLVFVNHDDNIESNGDLESVITGSETPREGSSQQIFRKHSNGRIKKEKLDIHLYIWVSIKGKRPKFSFTINDRSTYCAALCNYFDISPNDIVPAIIS